MRGCHAVFAFWKNLLFVKSVLILKQFILCNQIMCPKSVECCKITLTYLLAAEEVEMNSFFLRLRKLRVKRNKKQNHKLFCNLMSFII